MKLTFISICIFLWPPLTYANFHHAETWVRASGYIFNLNGQDYFTTHLHARVPAIPIHWDKKQNLKDICKSATPGDCAKINLRYLQANTNGKYPVLERAQIINPLNDPDEQEKFLKSVVKE